MKILKSLSVFILILSLLVLNILTLQEGHNWGGDFSQYILHAQNILNHKNYSNGIMFDLPVVYPPGFPILLAPVIKVWGVHWLAFKTLNVLFWFLTVFLLFLYLKPRLNFLVTILSILVMSASYDFFVFKQNVLSDIPFMFFVLAALLIFQKYDDDKDNKGKYWFVFSLFLMCAAFLIRSAGAGLFISVGLYCLAAKRWKNLLGLAVVFVLTFSFQLLWTGFHSGFFSKFSNHSFFSLQSFFHNAHFSWRSLVQFFFPYQVLLPESSYIIFDQLIVNTAPLAYVLILFVLIWIFYRRQATVWDYFIFVYGGVLLFWSGTPIPRDGFERLVFPLIAPFLIWAFGKVALLKTSKVWMTWVLGGLLSLGIMANGMSIGKNFDFNDDVLYQQENQELFEWVKEHVSEEDHYLFGEPRVLKLMTGRIGTSWWIVPDEKVINLPERIKKFDISYLIAFKGFDQGLMEAFEANPSFYKSVWENKNYKVFKTLY
jgi:4-amino-4-deoxy-L-arabinose transferase-like glycosyltransferase